METLLQDLRYGFRMLLKNPGFTITAIITLALGIGANTAIFSVINGVLLRPLEYPDSDRLAAMRPNVSLLNLEDIKSQGQSFEDTGSVTLQALDYTGGSEPVQIEAALIDSGMFAVLGAKPFLGRTISQQEDRFGAERVVVFSYGFWQRLFGGDTNVIGKSIPLSGNDYTVIGIMPQNFKLPENNPDVLAALRVVNPLAASYRGVNFLRSYWKLKKGVSLAQAQSEMELINKRLQEQYPAENKGRVVTMIALQERIVGAVKPALFVLFGAVCLVLLIACANFANLLLARAATRQQEIVIRAALGAKRGRLIRQMLTESVLLSLIGGGLGLMIALWSIDLLLSLKPANLPRINDVSIDWRVLYFTFGISFLTGLIFGLIPALNASRANVSEALRESGRSATAGATRHRLLKLLVVSELALSLVLLIGSGLLIKTFWKLRNVDPGFKPENIVTMRIELPESRYSEIPKQTQFRVRLMESLNSMPGIRAAMISELPMSGSWLFHNFIIDGRPPIQPGEEPELHSRTISGDYFSIMSIPLLKGRYFTSQDNAGSPLVGIVNESMVREYFPNEDPIGKRIRWARMEGEPQWFTIVGVASDVKHFGMDLPDEPAIYTPYEQLMQPWKRWMNLAVRSDADLLTTTGIVKSQIWSIDKQIPVKKVQTMSEMIASSFERQRFNMTLLSIFAAIALVLASVGIYGVISYSVSQRTHEIGIRMALGAQRLDVLRLILKQGLLLAFFGVVIGIAASLALTRFLSSLLFSVSATDPIIFLAISLLLSSVAILACYIPARRATKVDPMIALRYE
jgi:putative ABC transport system permease protein